MSEIWKPVAGYEDIYEVSADGQVRNVKRAGRKMAGVTVTHGYKAVTLYKEGQRKMMLLHRVVAEAFIPNPENKPQVNHINGNKADNRVENLEWATAQENLDHAKKTGLTPKQTRENEPAELMIRLRESKGWTQKELADRAGVGLFTVQSAEEQARFLRDRCVNTVHKIAKALGVSIEVLAGYDDEEVTQCTTLPNN